MSLELSVELSLSNSLRVYVHTQTVTQRYARPCREHVACLAIDGYGAYSCV